LIYPVLEVIGLVNRFGNQIVHDGLNMEIREDEVFGIVGGSGTGKSVLLRSILGLQRPQAGIIRIEGRDITQMSLSQLHTVKARYGVTFQQERCSLRSQFCRTCSCRCSSIFTCRRTSAMSSPCSRCGWRACRPDAAQKFPAQLSGGMIKRAALAGHLPWIHACCFSTSPPPAWIDQRRRVR